VMDSLRYWVEEMHVDGFRFDLASALAREDGKVEDLGGFFDAIRQDPVLARVKLIAEPWDLGHGGYQVGRFPLGWSEWNDQYRDGMRGYWKGDGGLIGQVARRLTGSEDLYGWSGKRPYASINFVTAHDGFTLHDLVSYNEKHNEANGENNQDGSNHNVSWNCGVEGSTEDPQILALRERQKRNLLATLLLSQGVPMLLAGDERGNTQDGNNNVYCQDNASGWIDWQQTPERESLTEFVRRLIGLRRDHPSFRRRSFFVGRPVEGDDTNDVCWLKPDGSPMTEAEWNDPQARCLLMLISGRGIVDRNRRGERQLDDDFLLLMNSHHDDLHITLPVDTKRPWRLQFDTAEPSLGAAGSSSDRRDVAPVHAEPGFVLRSRSVVLMRRPGRAP
jgi:isoamylase